MNRAKEEIVVSHRLSDDNGDHTNIQRGQFYAAQQALAWLLGVAAAPYDVVNDDKVWPALHEQIISPLWPGSSGPAS